MSKYLSAKFRYRAPNGMCIRSLVELEVGQEISWANWQYEAKFGRITKVDNTRMTIEFVEVFRPHIIDVSYTKQTMWDQAKTAK